jgi:hypothetical protein
MPWKLLFLIVAIVLFLIAGLGAASVFTGVNILAFALFAAVAFAASFLPIP